MDNFQSVLGDAAGNALCNVLTVAGASAPLLFAVSLRGGGAGTGTAAAVAGLAGVAANYGCNYDPDGVPPDGNVGWTGCKAVTNNNGNLYRQGGLPTDPVVLQQSGIYELISITQTAVDDRLSRYEWSYTESPGGPVVVKGRDLPRPQTWELLPDPQTSDVCVSPAPGPIGPDIPPYIHTDPASGCSLEVNFLGWGVGGGGMTGPVFEMKPAAGTLANTRNAVGGCNFLPTIHYSTGGSGGGDGGPVSFPVPDPVPPDGPEPWWAAPLRGALQGAAQAAAAAAIEGLTEAEYPEDNYALRGVCELDPDGNPIDVTRSTNWPAGAFPAAVLNRLDALADMFQFDKDLRQPTCKEEVTPVTGDPVTINFASDIYTPTGNNVARKRFVYFDQNNTTLEDTVNHWKDFTWEAGPVIVNCLKTKLGKPQVWAASVDEAKRVFAHAAAIAGVDLSNAEYPVTTPKSTRYGFVGLMRVSRDLYGTFGITKRNGPSGRPAGLG